MEYRKITNPITNRKVNTDSKLGKQIINTYIQKAGSNKCPITDFVYHLYDSGILFPTNLLDKQKQCFLRGTFVFEDNNSEVFKMLEKAGCNKTQSFWKTTHSEVRHKDAVDASLRLKGRPKGVKVEEKWKFDKDSKNALKKFFQYEHKIDPAIVYLCDKLCRTAEKNNTDICKEKARIDPKEVLFMYHFMTKSKYGKPRKYTLLKLEGHFSISAGHTLAAVKRYGLGKEGKTAYKTTRREDCFKKNSCLFKDSQICDDDGCTVYNAGFDYHVYNFINNNKDKKNSIVDSIKFYYKHLRTGDELFIPQEITNILLKDFK
tara:strand:- start:5230 stop:6183 length:954 start_codon:yes stop_codon:yes gene_type:complete